MGRLWEISSEEIQDAKRPFGSPEQVAPKPAEDDRDRCPCCAAGRLRWVAVLPRIPVLSNDAPFLAEFDATGQHLWSRGFAAVNLAFVPLNMINGVAYAGTHDVVLTGDFPGQIDLGAGPLTTKGGFDISLAKLLLP